MPKKRLPLILLLLMALLSCVSLTGCDPISIIGVSSSPPATTTADTLKRMGRMAVAIRQDTSLMTAIENAPAAIIALPRDTALTPDSLTPEALRRHVVLAPLTGDGTYTSVAGTTWTVTGFPDQMKINGVPVRGCTPTLNRPGASSMSTNICLLDRPL